MGLSQVEHGGAERGGIVDLLDLVVEVLKVALIVEVLLHGLEGVIVDAGAPTAPLVAVGVGQEQGVPRLDVVPGVAGNAAVVAHPARVDLDAVHTGKAQAVVGLIDRQDAVLGETAVGGEGDELLQILAVDHVVGVVPSARSLGGHTVVGELTGPVLVGDIGGSHAGLADGLAVPVLGGPGVVDIDGFILDDKGEFTRAPVVPVLVVVDDGGRLALPMEGTVGRLAGLAPAVAAPPLEGACGGLGAADEAVIADAAAVGEDGGGIADVVPLAVLDDGGIADREPVHGVGHGVHDHLFIRPGLAAVGGLTVGEPVGLVAIAGGGEPGVADPVLHHDGGAVAVAPGLGFSGHVDVAACVGEEELEVLGHGMYLPFLNAKCEMQNAKCKMNFVVSLLFRRDGLADLGMGIVADSVGLSNLHVCGVQNHIFILFGYVEFRP